MLGYSAFPTFNHPVADEFMYAFISNGFLLKKSNFLGDLNIHVVLYNLYYDVDS